MADFYKTNFKAQTPGDEPLQNIFDLLTPEEKAQYAKNFQPTTKERVFTGLGGVADVISSAGGGRNDHYYGEDMQKRSDNRIGQDMQFVGNELTRKYAERQAKAAAEKENQEKFGLLNTIEKDYPNYFDPSISEKSALEIYGKKGAWDTSKYAADASLKKSYVPRTYNPNPTNLKVKYLEKYNTATKKYVDSYNFAKNLENVVNLKNPIGDQAAKVLAARASSEVGNLAQNEQERFGGSKAISDRLQNMQNQLANGTISDSNRSYLLELSKAFQENNKNNIKNVAGTYSKQYGQIFSSPDELYRLANPDPSNYISDPIADNSNSIPQGYVRGTDNGEEGYIGPDGLFYTMEEMRQ